MSSQILRRKISLLFKFRDYLVKEENGKEIHNIVVMKRGANEKILVRVILKSNIVGVHYIRDMKKEIEQKGFKGGILIGNRFTHAATREARNNHIEILLEASLPIFNIFDHELVPKHEILPEKEVHKLLSKYRIKPYQLPRIKASDPIVKIMGAKPGDILKITRKSATARSYVSYRYVL